MKFNQDSSLRKDFNMNARIARPVRSNPRGGRNIVSTGNAKVYDFEKCEVLVSYGTPVAVKLYGNFVAEGVYLPAGTYRTERNWSHTTNCHLGRWNVGNATKIPQSEIETVYDCVRRN